VDCWNRIVQGRNWALGLNFVLGGWRNDNIFVAVVALRLGANADVNIL